MMMMIITTDNNNEHLGSSDMCQAYFTCNSFITSPRTNFPYLGSWPGGCRLQFASPAPEKKEELVGRTLAPVHLSVCCPRLMEGHVSSPLRQPLFESILISLLPLGSRCHTSPSTSSHCPLSLPNTTSLFDLAFRRSEERLDQGQARYNSTERLGEGWGSLLGAGLLLQGALGGR